MHSHTLSFYPIIIYQHGYILDNNSSIYPDYVHYHLSVPNKKLHYILYNSFISFNNIEYIIDMDTWYNLWIDLCYNYKIDYIDYAKTSAWFICPMTRFSLDEGIYNMCRLSLPINLQSSILYKSYPYGRSSTVLQ